MKRFLLYIVFVCTAINMSADIHPWGLISQNKTSWNPMTPNAPFKLEITPTDSLTCDVTGVNINNFTKFSGKIQRNTSDGAVSISMQGRAANGVSMVISGAVKASNDGCLVIVGKFYAEGSNGSAETPTYIVLENAQKAIDEKKRLEEERAERERKENSMKELFVKLTNEQRIGIKEKKKINLGVVVETVSNGRAVDALNAVNKNRVVEVLKPDAEASGQVSNAHLHLTLTSGQSINVDFTEKKQLEIVPYNITVVAWYAANADAVLYVCGSNSAFLYYQDKVVKLDKKTMQSITGNL